jgi:hypothetical protein
LVPPPEERKLARYWITDLTAVTGVRQGRAAMMRSRSDNSALA